MELRVLFLIDSLGSGGKERRLLELIKGLGTYEGVKIHLVLFSTHIHYSEVYDMDIELTVLERVPKKNPMVLYRLYKLCKLWKPDIVHSWGSMAPILALPSTFFLRIPLVNGIITDAPEGKPYFKSKYHRLLLTLPFSKVVLANSKAGLKSYRLSERKGRCIYNGFDIKRLSNLEGPKVIRERFKVGTEKVVGMVGSFTNKKDYWTFIDAALLLVKDREDVSFMAVGEGPVLNEIKAKVPEAYRQRIIFTGVQGHVESLINIFDVGVLCTNSQVHGEGISNAILEYMALAKPVVATIGGGTVETVVHDETGFLVPPATPKALAEHLNKLLNDPALCAQFGQTGKKRLENVFSLDHMTEAHYGLYQTLLKKG